ncbi:hypothetical protein [Microvirga arabica]|uniref:hypothetical protein n=1 Tax=Microvirga arabica TaxID=1128671 RepID=UPI00193A18A5|nr:hypothetical protein [Microvirga arabica]MBM1174810.1 hypothetical protein [Microvirga arabica]
MSIVRARGETQITASGDYKQLSSSSAAVLPGGGWIVTWVDTTVGGDHQVFQQRFDAAGQAVTPDPIQVSTSGNFSRSTPKVAALSDGGWLVTWTSDLDPDVGGAVVYQQRYDRHGNAQFTKDGSAQERLVSAADGQNDNASVSALPDGGWIVTWQADTFDGNGADIYLQRYDSSGSPQFQREGGAARHAGKP